MTARIIVYKALSDNESYWPEFFPVDILKSMMFRMGPVSSASQYQSSPMDLSGNYLKSDWINYYNFEERPILFDNIIVFIDPAVSQKSTADYFALAVGGTINDVVYLLDLVRVRTPLQNQMMLCNAIDRKWSPSTFVVEATGQQGYLIQYLQEQTELNIVPPNKIWNRANKDTKFSTLASFCFSKQLLIPGIKDELGDWIPIEPFKIFLDEWISYPDGHDDTLDAVAGIGMELSTGQAPISINEEDIDIEEVLSSETNKFKLTEEEKIALDNYYNGGIYSIYNQGYNLTDIGNTPSMRG